MDAVQMTTEQKIQQYKAAHPVLQATHTGKWGFERVYDCFDLSRAVYASKRAAELARSRRASQTELLEI